MPITKSMVQKAQREQAAAKSQAAAQKAKSPKKRQREVDDTAECEEEEPPRNPIRETRSQTRKRQLQESEVGPSRQATPPKRRSTSRRSKASRRQNSPSPSGPVTRFKGTLSDGTIADLLIQGIRDIERKEKGYSTYEPPVTRATTRSALVAVSEAGTSKQAKPSKRQTTARTAKPRPSKAAPSTSNRVPRCTTRNQGESIQTESTEDLAPKDKGKAPVYPPQYYAASLRSLASQPDLAASIQQPVQDHFDISAATSQAASLLPQFYGQGTPATLSCEPPVTRSSTCVSTEFETGTSNARTSAVTEGSQYVPGSDSGLSEVTHIQRNAASEATSIQSSAASDATVMPAAYSRRRKTTYRDRAALQKEAQKKAKDELEANTGYGAGTKTSAFLHWIPIPSDREYLQKIESALWRRNSMKKERGKGRGYRDAWWWHFADHYKIQADGVSCELDYSELMRASAEASVFSDKPGLKKITTPICDRCFFLGRACKTDQVNACISCIRAFQPCTMTERKHPFTRRQFTGQQWINHGFDIKFNIIKKPTEDPHRLFCDWEGLPLPPPPKSGELVYLRGKSLERPNPNEPKAVPRLPFNRAYQVPDRIYEKYNLHEVDWPYPLPDPFPVGDEEPSGETPEERERRLATKLEVEEKRVEYNRRQQERRQLAENGELPTTRRKGIYSMEWQKARQKKMMADYHQRTMHSKKSNGSTRGRPRPQSGATSSMAEVRPEEQVKQQTEQQVKNGIKQQIQLQEPPLSQTEAPVRHENDIEMGYSISQATTDHENEDAIMADAANAMFSHSDIPIDPALERMQFYNPLPPENGRRTRARTKIVGGKRQKTKASINKHRTTNDTTTEASQPSPKTVTESVYQILQQAADAVPNEPPSTSTSNIPPPTAQASWDNPYPDPPAPDTDAFGYYATAGVEATPEDLPGYPVMPNRSTYRPPYEAHNEWYIPNPYADPVPPASVPTYPAFSPQSAQQHNEEQNQEASEDVDMADA
ncbi:hypothetical protein BDV10DRAFT_188165 [Aspergillus recurvatus]